MMKLKKGLLIAPCFPADSFWSYKHVLKYVGREAAFPPLGLLTFAAYLSPEEWDLQLLDLNVRPPSDSELRRLIQDADAVFAGAMNIQRDSLVDLLSGPAKDTDTPWVLGGPIASTYRDTILEPTTESDQILHDGLDFLVWGESEPWIDQLLQAIDEQPKHSTSKPRLFIPQRVLDEVPGARKYLLDKEIFKPLDTVPLPRWDLLDVRDYRTMMIQTTAGCRFRCNFCDIVQFNGGFARAKDKDAVKKELQSIYDTGFRGGIFTVDDNFVSEPGMMEFILEGMIEFQRQHNYPFAFFTQASIDLGKDGLSNLIPMMKRAGFVSVFLGIENPDPVALKTMNKMQNIKTKPEDTVRMLQEVGIEVYAGFIYGTDGDTLETANTIVQFVKDNAIFSAMTGKLTPMPHTPLYVDLEKEGRLIVDGIDARNNIDETLQYVPVMGLEQLQEGFRHILSSLFSRKAIDERALDTMERVDVHLFAEKHHSTGDLKAVLRSFTKYTLMGRGGEFVRYLRDAVKLDRKFLKELRAEESSLKKFWSNLTSSASDQIEISPQEVSRFAHMIDYAQDSLVRYNPEKNLPEIGEIVKNATEAIENHKISTADGKQIYEKAMQHVEGKANKLRFPGRHLVRAFELRILGLHYETVVGNVLMDQNKSPV
jgi:radical SAM superfamily enzyme YgiQ (UPF0313 family)